MCVYSSAEAQATRLEDPQPIKALKDIFYIPRPPMWMRSWGVAAYSHHSPSEPEVLGSNPGGLATLTSVASIYVIPQFHRKCFHHVYDPVRDEAT